MYDLGIDSLSALMCVDKSSNATVKPYLQNNQQDLLIKSLYQQEVKALKECLIAPHQVDFKELSKLLYVSTKYYKRDDDKISAIVSRWTPRTFERMFTGFNGTLKEQIGTLTLLSKMSTTESQGLNILLTYTIYLYISKLLKLPQEVRADRNKCVLGSRKCVKVSRNQAIQLCDTITNSVIGFPVGFVYKYKYLLGRVKGQLNKVLAEM